jgi:hypothetical protein
MHISQCTPTWIDEVVQGYQHDSQAQELLTQLTISSNNDNSQFTLVQGVIRHKGRVWLGNNTSLQLKIIAALHDSALGGHSGFLVTYRRIKPLFIGKE